MRLSALNHLIDSVRSLTQCTSVTVLGSAALLATRADLGEADGPVEATRDADFLIAPADDDLAAVVHEALGAGSLFDARNGYHADLMRPAITSTLAPGWEDRLLPLANARALAAIDVAAVKVRVGRAKDLKVVAALVERGVVDPKRVLELVMSMGLSERDCRAAVKRLAALGPVGISG